MTPREIAQALIDSGLTQMQVAERTGVPQPTLSKLLRGEVEDVLSRNYLKLAAAHEARLAELKAAA